MTENVLENDDDVADGNDTEREEYHAKLEEISMLTEEKTELTTTIHIPITLYNKFSFYEDEKYNDDPDLIVQNRQSDINKVWELGVNQYTMGCDTSSSSSSYGSKKIRKDEWVRRAKIAFACKSQNMYPDKFRKRNLEDIINGTLRNMDPRVKTKYMGILESYSQKDRANGTFNIEKFYQSIPEEYLELAREEFESGSY